MKALLIGAAAVLAFGAPKRAPEPQRLTIRLSVTPLVGFAPMTVRVTPLVKDPKHELHCPYYAWDWGEGAAPSTQQSDCDPYAMPENEPSAYAPLPRMYRYRIPGSYEIRFGIGDQYTREIATQRIEVLSRSGL